MCATGTLKAIETQYNGYLFRSRLEARWAVFFDTLDIPYQYEVEGFDLDGIWYLPDFYLPIQKDWIEIKPSLSGKPWEEWPDHPMFDWLVRQQEQQDSYMNLPSFHLIVGEPWADPKQVRIYRSYRIPGMELSVIHDYEAFSYMGYIAGDKDYFWCECPTCGCVGLVFDGWADRLPCKCEHRDGHTPNNASPRIMAAYYAARQARFEHGEFPYRS